jgi:hypothetical protein
MPLEEAVITVLLDTGHVSILMSLPHRPNRWLVPRQRTVFFWYRDMGAWCPGVSTAKSRRILDMNLEAGCPWVRLSYYLGRGFDVRHEKNLNS